MARAVGGTHGGWQLNVSLYFEKRQDVGNRRIGVLHQVFEAKYEHLLPTEKVEIAIEVFAVQPRFDEEGTQHGIVNVRGRDRASFAVHPHMGIRSLYGIPQNGDELDGRQNRSDPFRRRGKMQVFGTDFACHSLRGAGEP